MIKYNIHYLEPTAVTLDYVLNSTQQLGEFDLVICFPKVETQITKYVLPHKLMVFGIRIYPLNLLVLQARLAAVTWHGKVAVVR